MRYKIKPEEIKNKEAYFRAWLYFEKKHSFKVKTKINKHEVMISGLNAENIKYSDLVENATGDMFELYMGHNEDKWLDTIENPKLYKFLKTLNKRQIKIMYLYYVRRMSQREVAKELNITQQALSKQILRLKNKILNIL